jgi:hypothetical protein
LILLFDSWGEKRHSRGVAQKFRRGRFFAPKKRNAMKITKTGKTKLFVTAVAGALLWLCSTKLAEAQVAEVFSISGTVLTQGSGEAAPVRSQFTTASLLKQLALDERIAGKWTNDVFPAGSKLIYYPGPSVYDYYATGFQVVDRKDNNLLAVSNILSLTNFGSTSISNGTSAKQLATLNYDATPVGGTNKFFVSGLGTSNCVAQYGLLTQSSGGLSGPEIIIGTFSLQDGTGEGVNADGFRFLLAGVTVTSRGSLKTTFYLGGGLGGFSMSRGPKP